MDSHACSLGFAFLTLKMQPRFPPEQISRSKNTHYIIRASPVRKSLSRPSCMHLRVSSIAHEAVNPVDRKVLSWLERPDQFSDFGEPPRVSLEILPMSTETNHSRLLSVDQEMSSSGNSDPSSSRSSRSLSTPQVSSLPRVSNHGMTMLNR